MPDRIETVEKVIASVTGIGAIVKAIHWLHRSVAHAVTAPIVAKMEEQIIAGKSRDEHIGSIKATLEKHIADENPVNEAVVRLEKELRPNGGASVPDKLARVLDILESQGARFLALHDDNPQGIFLSNLEGECTWVNSTLLRITGHSEYEMLGWNWLNQISEEDVAAVRTAWALSFKENREYKHIQTYVTSTGAKVRASVIARPIYAPDDSILEWVGFVHELPPNGGPQPAP